MPPPQAHVKARRYPRRSASAWPEVSTLPAGEALAAAAKVVQGSNREHPADRVLRQVLKNHHGLSQETTRQISRGVFAYFRWRGWLEAARPLQQQVRAALGLSERFAREPASFAEPELVARAVPGWVKTEMKVSGDWVRALQAEPRLWLRTRQGQGTSLARTLGDCGIFGIGPLADTLEYQGSSDLFRTAAFHEGVFEIQDISSQAVGLICAPQAGETWWDACAGEGGKTLQFSELMRNKGLIWASDRAGWRLEKLKRRAARAGVYNYRMAVWDGTAKLPTRTKFDGVLMDAPCSGIGTWGRNPHARWTTRIQDVEELGKLQYQLLRNAADLVKPGGKLIYAVCTLARSETTLVTEKFEKESLDFEPMPFRNPLDTRRAPDAQLFLWPQDVGGNGMFIAGWIRRAVG